MSRVRTCLALTLLAFLAARGIGHGQTSTTPADPEPATDVFDLLRRLRQKEPKPEAAWDYREPMIAVAPVIGAKPSSGVLLGAAGNVAFYRGRPATTHISSAVASFTVSTKGQVAVTNRFTIYARDDRWRIDGDHRAQWTSLETHALGTSADTRDGIVIDYDFFRLHNTVLYRVRPKLFAGGGLYYDAHVRIGPAEGAEGAWAGSPYVDYTETNGLPLDAQAAAGASVDLLWESRDSSISPTGGWLARGSYRTLFEEFLGGDSSWQRVSLDVRTYHALDRDGRHKLAGWFLADLVVGGVAPYFDLPAMGLDMYGRSARGYAEGQFRGERLAYAEIEYRGTLTRNRLLGIVAFLNVTSASNRIEGEQLFDSFATGGGAGLRLLVNKRSRTNLCLDFGVGKQGSRGVYLAVQEAF
jgi:hypothetical protein